LIIGLAPTVAAAASKPNRHPGHAKVTPGFANSLVKNYKLDDEITRRAKTGNPLHKTSIIVSLFPGASVPAEFKKFVRGGRLNIINGQVLEVPDNVLRKLEAHPNIFRVHFNRPLKRQNYRTSLTIGSPAVQRAYGLTGAGVGVAVIDSGITTWHDDLTNRSSTLYPYGDQRVTTFVDFVNGQALPYDDAGHGTHVAGIIAGNGYDSAGQKSGVAPDASLVVLKVLDATGGGQIGNIIAALDWVLANHTQYNIRVVNMSIGASVSESYWTDPLTLATKRVVDAGVVVVAAAGNRGKNAQGQPQWGAIVAPGNAPWVITVGASSSMGTTVRSDDTMAGFSSRGPTYLDWEAKPDLAAPGHGIVSLAAPGSTLATSLAQYLVPGSVPTGAIPYLSLSGTSMAAPVVTGTVALMMQANPALTPNAVKAILQYTAEERAGYKALEEGAGFLNAVGAIRLARFFATAQPGDPYPTQSMWSKRIIWGNHMLSGGVLTANANAWDVGTTWGVATASDGDNIVWGTVDGIDNIVWGTSIDVDNIVWGTGTDDDNIVWGTDCGGADCDNVVWGTADEADNIIWGTADEADNIIWGTADEADNIVWGTAAADVPVVWTDPVTGDVRSLTWDSAIETLTDEQVFDLLNNLASMGGL
jgi:serine protease AprX